MAYAEILAQCTILQVLFTKKIQEPLAEGVSPSRSNPNTAVYTGTRNLPQYYRERRRHMSVINIDHTYIMAKWPNLPHMRNWNNYSYYYN